MCLAGASVWQAFFFTATFSSRSDFSKYSTVSEKIPSPLFKEYDNHDSSRKKKVRLKNKILTLFAVTMEMMDVK